MSSPPLPPSSPAFTQGAYHSDEATTQRGVSSSFSLSTAEKTEDIGGRLFDSSTSNDELLKEASRIAKYNSYRLGEWEKVISVLESPRSQDMKKEPVVKQGGKLEELIKEAIRIVEYNYSSLGQWKKGISVLERSRNQVSPSVNPELYMDLIQTIIKLHIKEGKISDTINFLMNIKQEKNMTEALGKIIDKEIEKYSTDYLIEEDTIRIREEFNGYSEGKEILKETLKHFNHDVYFKIDPWSMGTGLFCYKQGEEVTLLEFDHDFEQYNPVDYENFVRNREIMENIKDDSSCKKITVWFDLE